MAKHFYRPSNKTVIAKYEKRFTKVSQFTVKEVFGDWRQTQKKHLADGALFDRIYLKSTVAAAWSDVHAAAYRISDLGGMKDGPAGHHYRNIYCCRGNRFTSVSN